MKTLYTKRMERPGTVNLCEMRFTKNANLILDFGDEKIKFGKAFLADAAEHYLNYLIEKGLEYAAKVGNLKEDDKS